MPYGPCVQTFLSTSSITTALSAQRAPGPRTTHQPPQSTAPKLDGLQLRATFGWRRCSSVTWLTMLPRRALPAGRLVTQNMADLLTGGTLPSARRAASLRAGRTAERAASKRGLPRPTAATLGGYRRRLGRREESFAPIARPAIEGAGALAFVRFCRRPCKLLDHRI
jgi:hypothetical protein